MTGNTSGDNNLTANVDAVSLLTVFGVTFHQSIGYKSVRGCCEVRACMLCKCGLLGRELGLQERSWDPGGLSSLSSLFSVRLLISQGQIARESVH